MIIGVVSAEHVPANRAAKGQERWHPTGWARLGQYLPYWRERHRVFAGTLWHKHDHLEIEYCLPDGSTEFVAPDLVYLQRVMVDMTGVLRLAKAAGQAVVQDLDDWFWGLDARNHAFASTHPKLNTESNRTFYAASLAESDVVTVSTPYLAERLAERTRGEIVLVPNHIDVARFVPVEHAVARPTIGWSGSTDHRSGDLGEVKGVLNQLRAGADFQHSGHTPDAALFSEQVGLPPEAVRLVGMVAPDDYPSILDFQIGLVPLRATPFNEAKSDIKGLEYAASGIPFVASPSGPYRQLRDSWGDCVRLAKKPADWVKHLRQLLDARTREDAAEELRKLVLDRDVSKGAQYHLDLFDSLAR